MRQDFYWSHTAHNVCTQPSENTSRATRTGKVIIDNIRYDSTSLPTILDLSPFTFRARYKETTAGSFFVMVVTDRISELAKGIARDRTVTTAVLQIFACDCLASFVISASMFTNNWPQFSSRFFRTIYAKQDVKSLTTMEYHPKQTV